jgi:anti-sigma B factor antagonist
MSDLFTIRRMSHDDGVVRIAFAGELDYAAMPVVYDYVDACLVGQSVTGVVADLAEVTFVDSSGIRALLTCRHMADDVGKTFRLINIQGWPKEVLDLTGVTPLLAVDPA